VHFLFKSTKKLTGVFGMFLTELKFSFRYKVLYYSVVYSDPLVSIGSDNNAVAPYGVLRKGKLHPRVYGTFPRVLGKYVKKDKIITLSRVIRKMTSVPAGKIRFTGGGRRKHRGTPRPDS